MLNLPPFKVFMPGDGGGPVNITHTADLQSTSDLSTYTFNSVSFGSVVPGRKIYVAFGCRTASGAAAATSVTIGGVSASLVSDGVTDAQVTNGDSSAEVWVASVPTGTSGTIVINLDTTAQRCSGGVWAAEYAGDVSDVVIDDSSPLSQSIYCPAEGGIIGYAAVTNGSATSFTWGSITEDFDEYDGENQQSSGAHDEFETEQTGLTVTATPGTGASFVSIAFSIGPA